MPGKNVYECMFLLDSGKVGGDIAAADTLVRNTLTKHEAEVLVSRPWDERRLAYPIRNQKKGLYYLTYFSCDGSKLVGIERDFSLNDTVLRLMVLRIHPKLVETMLAVASGEHAVALHNINDEADGGGPPPRHERATAGATAGSDDESDGD